MKKLDMIAIVLVFMMNWFLLAVIYRYDYFMTIFTKEEMYLVVKNVFLYGCTIIVTLMAIPRWFNYVKQRQIRIELGDIELYPFLNYHPEDVVLL